MCREAPCFFSLFVCTYSSVVSHVIVVVVVVVVFVAIDKDLQMYNSTTNKYTKNEVDVW